MHGQAACRMTIVEGCFLISTACSHQLFLFCRLLNKSVIRLNDFNAFVIVFPLITRRKENKAPAHLKTCINSVYLKLKENNNQVQYNYLSKAGKIS